MDWTAKIAFDHNKPPTACKIKVNNCKSIDLVKQIKIELTRAILMPQFSNSLRNSTIHFHMFLYLLTCFPRVAVSLLCRLEAYHRYMIQFIPIWFYIVTGDKIVLPCSRHSNETTTLEKHATRYKKMRKWIV